MLEGASAELMPSHLTSLGEAGNPGSTYSRVQLHIERKYGGPTGMPLSLKDQSPSPRSSLPSSCDLGRVPSPLWFSIPIRTVRLQNSPGFSNQTRQDLFSSLSSLLSISPSVDASRVLGGLGHREPLDYQVPGRVCPFCDCQLATSSPPAVCLIGRGAPWSSVSPCSSFPSFPFPQPLAGSGLWGTSATWGH